MLTDSQLRRVQYDCTMYDPKKPLKLLVVGVSKYDRSFEATEGVDVQIGCRRGSRGFANLQGGFPENCCLQTCALGISTAGRFCRLSNGFQV